MSGAVFRIISDAATGAKARALKRLAALPSSSTGRGLQVPLPYRDKEAFRAGLSDEGINAAIRAAPILNLSIDGLSSVQHSVQPAEVRRYIVAPGAVPKSDDPQPVPRDLPIVLEREGLAGRILWDGNHRATAAVLRGESTIRVRLAKLPASGCG